MEQRVLFQPEVICCTELLQWAGMFSCIGSCDSGAAAVCWRRSSCLSRWRGVGWGYLSVQLQVERVGGVTHD